MKKTIIVFTGAGVSADSGVATFRDNGGLWNNHKVEDVATPKGFAKNPQLVWNFYKERHDQLLTIVPNPAHDAIAKLQRKVEKLGFNFILVTQNVDRLHQSSGSYNVQEIHGNLIVVKCSECSYTDNSGFFWEFKDIPLCPCCGNYLRPNIVWFGESINATAYETAMNLIEDCHSILVVGSSCQVFPAASIVSAATREGAAIYESNLERSETSANLYFNPNPGKFLKGKASVTVPLLCDMIYNKILTDSSND
jgi:NAD-dependent deacetylase